MDQSDAIEARIEEKAEKLERFAQHIIGCRVTVEEEDHVRRCRYKVKTHVMEPHGVIRPLFPYADYGVIETPQGHDIYFHRNSVLNAGFDQLEIGGDRFHFSEKMGEKGPQASTVHVQGKHYAALK